MNENCRWFCYMIRKRFCLFCYTVFRDWNGVRLWPKLAWSLAGIIWHYEDEWGRKMWKRRGEQ